MLPDQVLSTTAVLGNWLEPDDIQRVDLTIDREMGGTGLNNPNDGLQVKVWRGWVDGNDVRCAPEADALLGDPGVVLFSDVGITELSLSFDQNMRPAVAYVAAGVAKLRWYDSVPNAQVTTSYPGAISPRVVLDDKRSRQLGVSDTLLFYLIDGTLYTRQQRDRFGVLRTLATGIGPTMRLARVGMNDALRLQIELRSIEEVDTGYTAAYSSLPTDTLYGVADTEVVPLFQGEYMTGRWRSRMEVSQRSQGFGWLRVNGELGAPVTLRFYGDGVLVGAITTSVRTPTRSPSGRWRRLELEVESTTRCTSVTLAGNAQDLRST